MADNLGPRWRHLARVVKGERDTEKAARKAIAALLEYAGSALRAGGYDASVLDAKSAGWTKVAAATVLPQIEDVFLASFKATAAGIIDPQPYATRHMEAVANRLAGVPDDVFDTMRTGLEEGRRAGEGITALALRVDGLLGDNERWTNRAVTIARTEVIGANNAGAAGSAQATTELLGEDPASVVKEWLATSDGRTRESHLEADGQQVLGLDTPFMVGGSALDVPGDPSGDPGEVVNCRCTVLFHYPGDSDYPADLAPGRGSEGAASVRTDVTGAPQPVLEHPVDPGPQNAAERAARTMTHDELAQKAGQRGTVGVTARRELRRRGLTAAGQEQIMAENEETQTGVVIVALPRADDPVQSIGPEQKHATLLYFGDVPVDGASNPNQLLDDSARALMVSVLEVVAGAFPSNLADGGPGLGADVESVESLGDDGARVWMLTGDPLTALRSELLDVDHELTGVLEAVEQYPSYTPHVTIGYPDESLDGDGVAPELTLDPATEEAAAAVGSITFDRLALWWGGEQIEYPLTATASQEDPPVETDPTTTASLDTMLADPRLVAALGEAFATALATFAPGDVPAPGDAPAGGPERAQDIPADGDPFHGILWPEATLSGDGRMIESGATVWRDLPLPFMAQDAQQPGHDGAVRVGRIDTIARDETTYAVPVIRYTGVWDTSPIAVETQRQVENKVARGVSVDGDDVTVELRGSDGQPLDPMVDDFPEDGVVIEAAVAARVAGSTLCSIPAFQQAYVANGTYDPALKEPGWNADGTPLSSGQVPGEDVPTEQPSTGDELAPVMASAWSLVAAAGPQWASSDFANPGLTEPTRLTVTDDGRVYGHLATWGTCHIGIDGICQEPPISATNYAYFATGSVATDGGRASVGQLTMETGHASMRANHRAAVAHYDNTGTAVADVAMGQDAVGIWFAGRLRPGTTPEQVYAMRAVGSVSGDWREVGGQLELVAALICNVPGFPIPVPSIAASGARPMAMVASGVVRPSAERDAVQRGSELLLSMSDVQAAVETVLATRDRTARATTAASRLRMQRATDARRRLDAQARRDRTTRVAAAAARLTKEG